MASIRDASGVRSPCSPIKSTPTNQIVEMAIPAVVRLFHDCTRGNITDVLRGPLGYHWVSDQVPEDDAISVPRVNPGMAVTLLRLCATS